ncbi:MAG: hypothetical protein IJQ11_10245 [Bacteroidales bacterium]|nr:hypothetical protein [Bacteroidales bacterium]
MKKLVLTLVAVIALTATTFAQNYGIAFGEMEVNGENAADIFGDGKASYSPEQNLLTLQEGFDYHLSKYFITIATGRDFCIHLEGNAEIYACIDCSDNLTIESNEPDTLKITANISGSALKCRNLTVNDNVTLDLLSRNSSSDFHALDCTALTVSNAILTAEVTTARLAVAAETMTLDGCWLQKPRGGGINPVEGGICFGDGIAAKQVRITTIGYGIEENDEVMQNEKVQKRFEDGKIVIIKDGKKYSITGQAL